MKILIIGAGVLGSNLAHSLKKGNDVTILAINKTFENLKKNGLVIKHKLGKKTVDHFNIIDKLDENDIYDVIFIVARFSSLDSIVPIIENKMNDYLKTHVCAVLPLVFACYKVNGNLKLLKKDKEYSLLIMDAIIEGYDVLKKLGYEILPKGEYENCVNKKNLCAFIYRFMFSNFIGKICISDHALSAREEFILLESEFEKLKEKSKLETKVYDKLKVELLN